MLIVDSPGAVDLDGFANIARIGPLPLDILASINATANHSIVITGAVVSCVLGYCRAFLENDDSLC